MPPPNPTKTLLSLPPELHLRILQHLPHIPALLATTTSHPALHAAFTPHQPLVLTSILTSHFQSLHYANLAAATLQLLQLARHTTYTVTPEAAAAAADSLRDRYRELAMLHLLYPVYIVIARGAARRGYDAERAEKFLGPALEVGRDVRPWPPGIERGVEMDRRRAATGVLGRYKGSMFSRRVVVPDLAVKRAGREIAGRRSGSEEGGDGEVEELKQTRIVLLGEKSVCLAMRQSDVGLKECLDDGVWFNKGQNLPGVVAVIRIRDVKKSTGEPDLLRDWGWDLEEGIIVHDTRDIDGDGEDGRVRVYDGPL